MKSNKKWDKILKNVAKQLHDGTMIPGQVSPQMIREHALEIFKAVRTGFDAVPLKNDINQYTILNKLRENVFVFSGFKNYQQLREMSTLLTDSQGNIRSFNEFLQDVLKIDKTYNQTYLQAEYNHAVSSSTLIAKWEKFKAEADIFPMLKYVTVRDGRVREKHKILDGVTLPIDDVFWNTYYPPNDWNCRCDVEQVEAEEKKAPKTPPLLPPMFRANNAKDGIVFPANHPYFKNKKDSKELIEKGANVARFSDPDENGYQLVYKSKTGHSVEISFEHHKDEVEDNFRLSKIVADYKHNVKLPPYLTGKKNDGVKNIDAYIDEIKADYKTPNKLGDVENPMKSIYSAIKAANTQKSEIVVIELNKIMPIISEYQLIQSLQGAVSFDNRASVWRNKFIKQIWLIYENKLLEFTRKEVLEYSHVEAIKKLRGKLNK